MAGLVEHVVAVIATRDEDEQSAYRAVCSARMCRRWKAQHRALTPAGFALAEHDGREHRRYRSDVVALTAKEG